MKKITGLLVGLYILPSIIFAQQVQQEGNSHGETQNHQVTGRVLDGTTNKGIGFATIEVLHDKDSSVLAGVLSKDNGDFTIDAIPSGRFILRINYISLTTVYHSFILTSKDLGVDIGNFKLYSNVVALQGVTITGAAPVYSTNFDKKVFNASKSLVSSGGDATDVLKQIPLVNIDIDGNVTIRNGTPKIYIDGKQTTLTLDQIPAESIDKVEVITNPSAKYDAEGLSGIINILLKKSRKPGINGSLRGGADTYGGYNIGADLSVYKNPFNFTAGFFWHPRNKPTTQSLTRHNIAGNNWLQQTGDGQRTGHFKMGQFGIDYFLNNRNTISFNGQVGRGDYLTTGTVRNNFLDDFLTVDSGTDRNTANRSFFLFHSGDLSYKHTFKKEGQNLSVDFNLQNYSDGINGNFQTQFFDKNGTLKPGAFLQTNTTNGKNSYFTAQVDYVNPFTKKSKLETGLKTTHRDYSSAYNVFDLDSSGYVFNNYLSSDYTFNENIYAAYAQFSSQWNKLGYELGLRAEQYSYNGAIPGKSLVFEPTSDKPGLFPSAFLTYKFNDKNQLQVNYSRRVDRPDFRQLIPYIDFTDPQNLTKGNPDLKPQYTNSFELSYKKNFSKGSNFMTTFYFRNIADEITNYTEPFNNSRDTLISYSINANTNNSYGAEFTLYSPIVKWWNITANVNLFQSNISANINSVSFANSKLNWFAKINSNMKLPSHFSVQIDANYNSPIAIPQGTMAQFGYVNLSLKKDFLKKKNASVTLILLDAFNTLEKETNTQTPNVYTQRSIEKKASRFLRLNFTYNFGKENFQIFHRKGNKSNQQIEQDLAPEKE
ncbi:MAG: TonB-dependent receptor [Chitinophagaceae bacterium]|nr:TonB-dependent receptor [Chitinophagaceae bacterium]